VDEVSSKNLGKHKLAVLALLLLDTVDDVEVVVRWGASRIPWDVSDALDAAELLTEGDIEHLRDLLAQLI
jgi:hypothetical protein